MNRPTSRLARGTAVAVAGVAMGLAATSIAVGSDDVERHTPSQVEQRHVADWATEHQLSGLSPASVQAPTSSAAGTASSDHEIVQELAEFARDHGLTGLSPASLHPIND